MITKSGIVVSKGLLKILNRNELQGVITHEVSHIVNRDTTYLLCSGSMYNILSDFTQTFFKSAQKSRKGSGGALLLALFSCIGQGICFILFMFISRKREYLADACACQFTRYTKGLANALMKIENSIKHQDVLADNERAIYLVKASFIVPLNETSDDIKSTHPYAKSNKSSIKYDFC